MLKNPWLMIKRWYSGTDASDSMFLMARDYHWTAMAFHRLIRFHNKNWFNVWTLIFTVIGVAFTALSLFK